MLDVSTNTGERAALEKSAGMLGAFLAFVSPDQRDVDAVVAKIERTLAAASDDDGGRRWRDEGYWLVPLLCLMALLWFRPGWVVIWK